MARKRMIDPNIWQSEDFNKLSALAKLVFIGLFSLADDEGRGRCNSVYLKSTLFPYNEDLRSADIDKTLSEISSNMSVIFYSCDGSSYYSLYNWNTWQKIDRPSESKIPEYDSKTMKKLFDDNSTNVRRVVSPNKKRIEDNKNINKKEKQFVPPTLDEIKKYVLDKKLNVSAEQFYNFFSEGNWIDSKGNKVKSWKQKILTWNNYSLPQVEKNKKFNNYEQRQYSNLEQFYTNIGE